MTNTEDKIKNLILSRYKSIREFSIYHDIPYTTIKSMLSRGINNSSVSNVISICKALNISVDALADGEIKHIYKPINDRFEIKEILEDTKDLLSRDDLTLDGDPIDKHEVDYIIDSMDVVIEVAKRRHK